MWTLISSFVINSALALPLYDEAGADNQNESNHCKVDHQGKQGGSSPWDSFGQYVDEEVYVYVSKDFAYRYNTLMRERCAGTGCGDLQTITQDQGRNIVMNAMEVWNRESRGPALIFAGETAFGLSERYVLSGGTCEDFLEYGAPDGGPIQHPAVIIDATSTSALGGVIPLKTSADGDWCYDTVDGFEGVVSLDVGNISISGIRPTMVHEFGHVLGLAHAWGDWYNQDLYGLYDIYDGPASVMLYDINEYNSNTSNNFTDRHQWRGHLWPYDVDCVDDDMSASTSWKQQDGRRRALKYGWWTYKPSGTYKPSENTWSTLQSGDWLNTSKSFSGGIMQPTDAEGGDVVSMFYADPWFDETYATWLHPKDFLSGSSANGEMDLEFYTELFEESSVNDYRPLDSWIAPTLYAMYNETDYTDSRDWMIAFPQTLRGGDRDNTDIDDADPPLWLVQGGERPGDNSHNGGEHHSLMTISKQTGTWEYGELRSHVSPRFAWDPVSGQTLLATVNTRDCDGSLKSFNFTNLTDHDRCGGILIYTYALSEYLLYPETLTIGSRQSFDDVPAYEIDDPTNGAFDQGYTELEKHSYTATTDVAPAIACAPKAHQNDGVSNCLLAWVDNGTPDGHILYTYFSVDGDDIYWGDEIDVLRPYMDIYRDRDASRTSGYFRDDVPAQSQSDLSAIYSDGRFFIAFKNSGEEYTESVSMVETYYQNPDRWYIQTTWTETTTIEAPTFVHDPTDENREWSLIWNDTDWGL
ncbi:MAG: hypothetical protein P8R54_05790 [Myxococcota bacterium]|nr:hypothetical protein [Myxococcota bacterium]